MMCWSAKYCIFLANLQYCVSCLEPISHQNANRHIVGPGIQHNPQHGTLHYLYIKYLSIAIFDAIFCQN